MTSDARFPPPDSGTEELLGLSCAASLTVKDLQKSLGWYQMLGFSIDRKHEREGKLIAISLRAGQVRLLLNQDDGNKGWDRAKGEGFSIMIATSQNVDEVADRIKKLGGSLESEPVDTPWGRMFRLRDPDGFRLTISK